MGLSPVASWSSSARLGCLLAALMGCGPEHLRAQSPPARGFVAMPPPPRPVFDTEGTVTVDTPHAPARVEAIEAESDHLTLSCETPCTLVLPRGRHTLRLVPRDPSREHTDTVTVEVGARPRVVRHLLSRHGGSAGGVGISILLGSATFLSTLVGVAFLAVGEDDSGRDLRPTAGLLLGAGLVLGFATWLVGVASRPTVQPGATTQWVP